jgi:hypothetical protein
VSSYTGPRRREGQSVTNADGIPKQIDIMNVDNEE